MARVLYRKPSVPTALIVASLLGAGYFGRYLVFTGARDSYERETMAQQRRLRKYVSQLETPVIASIDWGRVEQRVAEEEARLREMGLDGTRDRGRGSDGTGGCAGERASQRPQAQPTRARV